MVKDAEEGGSPAGGARRTNVGQSPLLEDGSPPAPAISTSPTPPHRRRRRINLTGYLMKQVDRAPPFMREHLTNIVEGCQKLTRSWLFWLVLLVMGFVVLQSFVLQYISDSDAVRLRPRKQQSMEQLEIEEDMDSAYRHWKVLQAANPKKFGNFSKFLMESKHKESRLRKRLSALSEESLNLLRNIVVPPAGKRPVYSPDEEFEMIWSYLMPEKVWPYVGSERYLEEFKNTSRHYFNSLAVFPHNNRTRMHGLVGIWPNGTRAWVPQAMPPPIAESPIGKDAELKDGGFYLKLSNALPLDRDPPDHRTPACMKETYNLATLDDASVVIVFYNEHLSTLLRSVHSVLNYTPPPLLREIILVDDHSNATGVKAGGLLDEYVKLLPKTKLLRLPERRGIVQARLAGAMVSRAPIFVMLDSHIEVGPHWYEPQALRLKQSPKSVVFPQILSLDSETLNWRADSGIGCFLSFKWMMQERPYFNCTKTVDPVASPSMAGGLFAVRRDWFFDIGGYDDEFKMWGAENVEMAFRYWMCGGRTEGIPCSLTYHIYRHGGGGYKSPGEYVEKNRQRTAILWLDRYYQLARHFIEDGDDVPEQEANKKKPIDLGNFEKMKQLKKRFKCKSFGWFLRNVDAGRVSSTPESFGLMGGIRNLGYKGGNHCIDNLQHKHNNEPFGLYPCHNSKGSQGWFEDKSEHQIRNMGQENLCLGSKDSKLSYCEDRNEDNRWMAVPELKLIVWANTDADLADLQSRKAKRTENFRDMYTPEEWRERFKCLGVHADDDSVDTKPCELDDKKQQWSYKMFTWDPNYRGPPQMLMDDYDPSDHDDDDQEGFDEEPGSMEPPTDID